MSGLCSVRTLWPTLWPSRIWPSSNNRKIARKLLARNTCGWLVKLIYLTMVCLFLIGRHTATATPVSSLIQFFKSSIGLLGSVVNLHQTCPLFWMEEQWVVALGPYWLGLTIFVHQRDGITFPCQYTFVQVQSNFLSVDNSTFQEWCHQKLGRPGAP